MQAANLVAMVGNRKYNSIICVAGGFQMGSISHENLFEDYEKMNQVNFQPALLAGHIATKSLTEQGLLVFTGAASVFEGPVNYASGYYFAKTATHALAMNMSELDCLPQTATVVTILPGMLDTQANREAMPNMETKTWLPTEKLAAVI